MNLRSHTAKRASSQNTTEEIQDDCHKSLKEAKKERVLKLLPEDKKKTSPKASKKSSTNKVTEGESSKNGEIQDDKVKDKKK